VCDQAEIFRVLIHPDPEQRRPLEKDEAFIPELDARLSGTLAGVDLGLPAREGDEHGRQDDKGDEDGLGPAEALIKQPEQPRQERQQPPRDWVRWSA